MPANIQQLKKPGSPSIEHLPDEVLSEIFILATLGVDSSNSRPIITLQLTCTRWNAIVLCTPQLWTKIKASLPWEERELDLIWPKFLPWLERSGALPLEIDITSRSRRITWLVFWHLLEEIGRCQTLALNMPAPIGALIDSGLLLWLNTQGEHFLSWLPQPNERIPTGLKSLQKLVLSCNGDALCDDYRIIHFFAPKLTNLTLSEVSLLPFELYAKLVAATPTVTHLTIGVNIFWSGELTAEIDISHPRLIQLDFTITEPSLDEDDAEQTSGSSIFNGLTRKSLAHLREATFRCHADVAIEAFWRISPEPPIEPLPAVRTVRLYEDWPGSHGMRTSVGDIKEFLSSFPNTEIMEYCIDWRGNLNRFTEQQLTKNQIFPAEVGGFCARLLSFSPTLKKLRSFSVLNATIEFKSFSSSFAEEFELCAGDHVIEPCYNLDEIVCVEGKNAMERRFTFEQISCSFVGTWRLPLSDTEKERLSHLVRHQARYCLATHVDLSCLVLVPTSYLGNHQSGYLNNR